jgi:hypothetical protein
MQSLPKLSSLLVFRATRIRNSGYLKYNLTMDKIDEMADFA